MPELTEVKIMSDYINEKSDCEIFNKIFHVEKGNNPILFKKDEFKIASISSGKELTVNVIPIYIFMGMSGNWKYVPTSKWSDTKFVRLRIDSNSGNSLILYGGYMGPKYSIDKPFTGTKRGPDPTKDFDKFKGKILADINKKPFDKPICDLLLNQEYFNGIGNYLRSTILYYADINPFEIGRISIQNNPQILELCRDIPLKSYQLHGGQLKDWKNPFDVDSTNFHEWVFYKKGLSCNDGTGRTFWFDPKWKSNCIYTTKNKK